MERKIGEVFECEGKKLQVKESHCHSCDGCFFKGHCEHSSNPIIGLCEKDQREDEKDVIFVEVQEQEEAEEQHQEEQPKLNLCEILRDCPRGTKLYSTVLGYVIFQGIVEGVVYPIVVSCENGVTETFTADGKMFIDLDGECTLFPSKEQRSWADFIAPWYKKEKLVKPKFKVGDIIRHKETNKDDVYKISKVYNDSYGIDGFTWMIYMKYQDQYELVPNKFDPKTLKAFDRVLVRIGDGDAYCWFADFVSIPGEDSFLCTMSNKDTSMIIPYNDDTKHLVGTTDEAPDFYRYWED
ncbi:hypothetical protein [Prevotella sp. P2-180]|uniref:hypothetical protein n=1 Tax=Prevotella sp. P2-180 TaxID=2024224 RepID=UPI000B96D2B3|nr:hypothetical protein [Prevotella sp. P2-180]OYP67042.1 hypothetical protein CIK98_06500 [Prevotella sp. P2-180]